MPLPINFLPDVKSKLDDAALVAKLRNEKKKSKLRTSNWTNYQQNYPKIKKNLKIKKRISIIK